MSEYKLSVCWLLLFLNVFSHSVSAQLKDSVNKPPVTDSPDSGIVNILKKFGVDEKVISQEKFRAGRIAIRQTATIAEIKKTSFAVKNFLRKNIDSVQVEHEIASIKSAFLIAKDGIFVNEGSAQTQRNLDISAIIVSKLAAEIFHRKNELDRYIETLIAFQDRIDSLSTDSSLYTYPSDSVSIVKLFRKLYVVAKELHPIDSAMTISIGSARDLQTKVDMLIVELQSALDDMEGYRGALFTRTFHPEFPGIMDPPEKTRPLREIISFSVAKEKLALNFYLKDNIGKLWIILLLTIIATLFIRSLKQRWRENQTTDTPSSGKVVLKYPLLSAIVIVFSLFQFLFLEPPFIVSFTFWLIPSICLVFILHRFISYRWLVFWCGMVALFFLAGMDNLILQASRPERWCMIILAIAGIMYGVLVLTSRHKQEMKEPRILYFIAVVVLFQLCSIGFNISGRYNLSKTMLTSGYIGIIIAIIFLWTVRLINEGLMIAADNYKQPERKLLYLNFERVGSKIPTFFYVLLVAGWFILVARNFYIFRDITDPFIDFLTSERKIGDYSFTVTGIFIFFIIMFCAVVLSRIISFFAADQDPTHTRQDQPNKVSLGSWILLIRIMIICIGLFIAFAATGIPIDRITIIMGALGVGIGLGLQGLVNNLVSGLIIAFEKPVNVGDIIELDGKIGTMKSIGFRSSVVAMVDGANIVVPNGDLLNQHLVNWTLGQNHRRNSIVVGVAYGSDLEKVKSLLENIFDGDERMMPRPAAFVLLKEFNRSSIDFEVFFWVKHIRDALPLKSDIIKRIDMVFKQNGIVIPFDQTDLRIRSINDEIKMEKDEEDRTAHTT